MYSETVECVGIAVVAVVRDFSPDYLGIPREFQVNSFVHIYKLPDGKLAYTTSPDGYGMWSEGSANSLEEIINPESSPSLFSSYRLEGAGTIWGTHGVMRSDHDLFGILLPEVVPEPAQVTLWDDEMCEGFLVATAATGVLPGSSRPLLAGKRVIGEETPATPGVVGQLHVKGIRGKGVRWEGSILGVVPDEKLAVAFSACSRDYFHEKYPYSADPIITEWERRGLDLANFSHVEVYDKAKCFQGQSWVALYTAPYNNNQTEFSGAFNPDHPVVVAAIAVTQKRGSVAELRHALRSAGCIS